ncbi:MAG: VWA domain-containing protein [Myxococcaceae bacterium]|nr:VWA domain-containing protein [Myxococcaceae bacterium]
MHRAPLIVLLASLSAAAQQQQAPTAAYDQPQFDVVFVLDTTSSMSGLIEGAKEKIWSIASRMASGKPAPRIRIGLVAFRDQGDAYVTLPVDLTSDLDVVYANLRAFKAQGGGDTPEHVGKGLADAVDLMHWHEGQRTAKMIFLVGDAPAHDDYQDGFGLEDVARRAIKKGIVVNTIRCGTDAATEKAFRSVARIADGTFATIGQAGDMVKVVTPYDSKLETMSDALAGKSLYGGSASGRAAGDARTREVLNLSGTSAADRLSYRAKAAVAAKTPTEVTAAGGFDLVLEPWRVEKLKDNELPEAVRAVPAPQRRAWLERQRAERFDLEVDVKKVAAERDDWLVKNPGGAGGFDDTVMKKVREKGTSVGIVY